MTMGLSVNRCASRGVIDLPHDEAKQRKYTVKVLSSAHHSVPFNSRSIAAALAAACLALACAAQTEYPRALYTQRHYIEAEDIFDRMEDDLPQLGVAERAEYGVYRGMTLLALGDFRRAQRWLSYATMLERAHPAALNGAQKALLEQGWLRIDAEQARLAQQVATPPKPETQATLPTSEAPTPP
jgi:tetratricopeptide (TPR) repeat protein